MMRKRERSISSEKDVLARPQPLTVGSMHTRRKALEHGIAPNSWVKSILQKHIEIAHSCHEQFARSHLTRARKQQRKDPTESQSTLKLPPKITKDSESTGILEQVSPFAQILSPARSDSVNSSKGCGLSFHTHNPGSGSSKVNPKIDVITYRDSGPSVPAHTYHIQLQKNLVTENNKKLNFNPNEIQFDNPQWSLQEYEDELKEHFTHGLLEQRAKPLKYAEISKYLRPFILRALDEISCSVDNILRYILDPLPDTSNKRQQRDLANKEGFGPLSDQSRWAIVLSKLPVSTSGEQDLARAVCEAFEDLMHFSIWHLVKHDSITLCPASSCYSTQASGMCRLCFRFSCTAHGEFYEEFEQLGPKVRFSKAGLDDINYRTSITLQDQEEPALQGKEASLEYQCLPKSYKYWKKHLQIFLDLDQESPVNYARGQFYPCSHQGTCESNECPCFKEGVNCEKFCGCSETCERRFPGCNCSHRGASCSHERCLCRRMDRECDPDICTRCGAADALNEQAGDQDLAQDEDVRTTQLCGNVGIQRGIPKRMLLGTSQVAGFGLFMGEPARAGDFLAEYKGELISKGEASRRQILHQYLREYLFELNLDQQLDSLYAGNKLRFINNANRPENINCDPTPMFCNGTIRMGLFATRDLQPGDELFFKYGYTEGQMVGFKEPTIKKPPLSKSAGQLQRNLKPTSDVDEVQNRRGKPAVVTIPTLRSFNQDRKIIEDSEGSYEGSISGSDNG